MAEDQQVCYCVCHHLAKKTLHFLLLNQVKNLYFGIDIH